MGGAKIDTKIGLIDHYIGIADHILIGGGMAFTLLKARGIEIGKSIVDDSKLKAAIALIDKAKKKKNLFFPKDIVCAKSIDKDENYKTYDITKIPKNLMGLDIGQKTIDSYSKLISNSQTVVWNGPMGVFESENFQKGTLSLGKHIATCSQGEFVSIIGGGDTAAALRKFNLDNNITPETITKSIDEIMITTSVAGEDGEETISSSDLINFSEMTKSEKEMILLDLRREMIELAEKLEFEKAAQLRDEIENIEKNIESVNI